MKNEILVQQSSKLTIQLALAGLLHYIRILSLGIAQVEEKRGVCDTVKVSDEAAVEQATRFARWGEPRGTNVRDEADRAEDGADMAEVISLPLRVNML
ncbi:hypothetical protein V6N12_076516 [Hibiscus sabdariffa]|uniref:Uncharacterized protein n=1 Tax=Hibiscus sabdariffa TaxID=183260 RepID=A0ABR2DA10_9ROSI